MGQVIMLDTTDPAQPKPVARWTLPVDPDWTANLDLLFSTHYVEVVDRTLFVSLYHGGVWAVDADPGNGPELLTLGVFIPDREPPSLRDAERARPAPEVLDILHVGGGDLVSFDGRSGAYVLRFNPSIRIPIPSPWTEDAWIS